MKEMLLGIIVWLLLVAAVQLCKIRTQLEVQTTYLKGSLK